MNKRIPAAAASAAVVAVTAGLGTAAAATHGSRPPSAHGSYVPSPHGSHPPSARDGGFGYTAVRKGVPDGAARFTVTSPDVRDGGTFPARAWADSFGCSGGNQPVRLSFSGAPAGTRSYAVTMFDKDAPTGSGFWHWLTWDIPAGTTALGTEPPAGSVSGTDDAGMTGYLGPCPPSGDIVHRYEITVYALDTPSLDLPATAPAAVTAVTLSGHIIGYARITATAHRG